jgi:CheY-like chemotaxis protein
MKFHTGELSNILKKLDQAKFTGTVALSLESLDGKTENHVLSFCSGGITFAGDHLPAPLEFVEFLKQKLQLTLVDTSIRIAEKRLTNKDSVRELLAFLNRFGLFKWESIEPVILQYLVVYLEPLFAFAGDIQVKANNTFDLSYGEDPHGFGWEELQAEFDKRQNRWQSLQPLNPESIPMQDAQLWRADLPEAVQEHLKTWVNGSRSLAEIAAALKQDSLELAEIYDQWRRQGWLKLQSEIQETTTQNLVEQEVLSNAAPNAAESASSMLPIILSVDDSAIVQVSIKRAIGDRYTVLCAQNAIDALNILNAHNVELLLLDVTMPDVDGLELCRTIRNMPRFKNLPIIMLTAKDGLIDKVKGQFAGSTQYLAKPVDREKLLPVLEKYITRSEVAV